MTTKASAAALKASQAVQDIIDSLPLEDLLGAPALLQALAKDKAAKFVGPKQPKVLLTTEEKKAKRNDSQRALRATAEGRAYANAASKKSIAARKAREAAVLANMKALLDALQPAADVAETIALKEEASIAAEEAEAAEEVLEVPVKPAKKASKKGGKKAIEEATAEVGEAAL